MGAVSLWTRLPPLYLCTRPQKIYPSSQLSRPTAGTCRCGNTATSTNVDELRHVTDNTPVVAHKRHATTVQNSTSCNCGSSAVSSTSALENSRTAQQGHRPPCSATVECPWSDERFGPWNLPLRHDGEVNLLDHNRDVENRVQQLGNVHGPTNGLDHGTCLCATTGK